MAAVAIILFIVQMLHIYVTAQTEQENFVSGGQHPLHPCETDGSLRSPSVSIRGQQKKEQKEGREMIKLGVTGHRPERMKKLAEVSQITDWLDLQFQNHDDFVLISGMAQGVDLVAAFEAFAFGGRLWCYYPFKRKPHDAEEYLETKADKIRYECEEYQKGCHIKRDRRIVDDCDILLAVWDGIEAGGTWQTIKYAREIGKPIIYFEGKKKK